MTIAPAEFFRLVDLSTVPVPDFVEVLDYEAIRKSAIDFLVSLDDSYTALLESDPAIKIIEAFCYREMNLRQRINDVALANTITKSLGGDLGVQGAFFNTEKMEGEDDERYRRRVQIAIYISAVGGPWQSYAFHALSADVSVVDVKPFSPEAGEVAVAVLAYVDVATVDATPDQLLIGKALFAQPKDVSKARILAGSSSGPLKAVRLALTPSAVRPMTDSVTVLPPNVIPFSINARLVIYPGPDANTVKAAALTSLATYLQSIRKVSYDATKAGIIAALKVGGVQNVILLSPGVDVVASDADLPVCVAVNVEVDRVDV